MPVLLGTGGILLVLILLPLLFSRRAALAGGPGIRVRLSLPAGTEEIRVSGSGLRARLPGGESLDLASPPWTFRLRDGILEGPAGPLPGGSALLVGKEALRLDPPGRKYPGLLRISCLRGRLVVVNELPLEAYVAGVLAGELGNHWPYAALQAQAVAARTYALWNRRRRREAPWHLTDTSLHQVYQGFQDLDSPVARAAADTEGQILMWKGEVLPAWYHSTCGGHTARAREIFPSAPQVPPLAGVPCPWCEGSPLFRWKAGPFAASRLEEIFRLPPGGRLLSLEGTRKESASGRWLRVRLETTRGAAEIPFRRLRRALGLKSSLILEVEIRPRELLIRGGGWGHGVGLCQWGAVAMAKAGRSWRNILSFYYPGAEVRRAW